MSLANLAPIGFIPTNNAAAAREFYEEALGLAFESADQYAIVFRVGPNKNMLRITIAPSFTPMPFTIYGWEVTDIDSTAAELAAKGIAFERYGFLQQDYLGIWNAPGGARIAWFKDPDGNTLSLSQHPV